MDLVVFQNMCKTKLSRKILSMGVEFQSKKDRNSFTCLFAMIQSKVPFLREPICGPPPLCLFIGTRFLSLPQHQSTFWEMVSIQGFLHNVNVSVNTGVPA